MGNLTNPGQWAAQERLRFIERSAWWRGVVNRQDLQTGFGVSQAQASSDLQKYLELNSSSLSYSLKRKRYEGTAHMQCQLHAPRLEEALAQFLESPHAVEGMGKDFFPSQGADPARVAGVTLPQRQAVPQIQRGVFLAVLHRLRIRIHYVTFSGKKAGWRWIAPHAFAHDGYRWHVRAWCEENGAYRDFVLSRIKEVEWPTLGTATSAPAEELEPDREWNTWVALDLVPNPALSEEQQEAVKADYDLKAGRMVLQVRQAMLDYTLAHLRLPTTGGKSVGPFLVERGIRDER